MDQSMAEVRIVRNLRIELYEKIAKSSRNEAEYVSALRGYPRGVLSFLCFVTGVWRCLS